MATYNSTQVARGDQPRALTSGITPSRADISGNTLTVNDIMQMVRVPNGARIVRGWAHGNGAGSYTIHIGDGGSANRFGSFSVSASLTRAELVIPEGGYVVSLTANANPQYDTIDLTVISVTGSATGSFQMFLEYLTDGQ